MFIKMKQTCRLGYSVYAKGQTYQVGEAFLKNAPDDFPYDVVPAPHASAQERQAFADAAVTGKTKQVTKTNKKKAK